MNDCLIYLKNIIKEGVDRQFKDKNVLDINITLNEVLYRLRDMFDQECQDYDENIIYRILRGCSKEDLNRIYYKNNIYDFLRNNKVKRLYRESLTCVELYNNPEEHKTPKVLRDNLEDLWALLNEYVFYNYEYTDRVYRVQNKERCVALVIDTDSKLNIGA
jgi:hypothetical protein